jgi:hypothetical protein
MAKGKHAAALFEVIHQNKKMQRPGPSRSASLFHAPKWWFNRTAAQAGNSLGEAPSLPVRVELPLEPAPPPRTVPTAPRDAARGSARREGSRFGQRSAPLSLQLNRRSALIGGVALVGVVTLAFTFGKRLGHTPTPLFSRTTDEIRHDVPMPSVLDIPRTGTVQTFRSAQSADPGPTAHVDRSSRSFTEPRQPATHMVADTKRTFGLNYVVIQSYRDRQYAEEAKDLLVKNDLFCTVEKDLSFAGKGWYSVVGLTGFDRIKNVREYRQYIAAIEQVGKQIPKNSRLKEFEPQAYKWR